jgi:hypothetical protein
MVAPACTLSPVSVKGVVTDTVTGTAEAVAAA